MQLNKFRLLFILGIMVTLMMGTVYPGYSETAGYQRNLGFGDIGSDVRWLQNQLINKGYELGSVDGIYGFSTRSAVKKYQQKNNLKVSGVFDKETFGRLMEQNKKKEQENNIKAVKLSDKELMLLARAVNGEARGESYEGQVAVAAVILNRVESPDFPQTVKGVIFQEGAFDAVDDNQIWLEPTKKSIQAAEEAAKGVDNTGDALYYYNPDKTTNKWIWSRPVIKRIGEHVFAR